MVKKAPVSGGILNSPNHASTGRPSKLSEVGSVRCSTDFFFQIVHAHPRVFTGLTYLPRKSSDDDQLGSNDELFQRGSSQDGWETASDLSETSIDLVQILSNVNVKLRRDPVNQASKFQLAVSSKLIIYE